MPVTLITKGERIICRNVQFRTPSRRDVAGRANQYLAHAADEVYFLIAGLPMTLKGPPSSFPFDKLL